MRHHFSGELVSSQPASFCGIAPPRLNHTMRFFMPSSLNFPILSTTVEAADQEIVALGLAVVIDFQKSVPVVAVSCIVRR